MIRYLPRTIATYVVGVVATLLASLCVLVLARANPTSPLIDRITRWWSRAWLTAAGCRLEVEGQDQIDRDRSYVVVANHSSNLDIMVGFLAVPLPIRYLAKKELFKVPILAPAMKAIGIVSVDRQARGAMSNEINLQSRALVAAGRSLIVYPEGTRSRWGDLAPFKKGAFSMAVAAQLPLLPVVIHGTHRAWPPSSAWVRGGTIRAVVDKPIETEGMTRADAGRLNEQVHAIMAERLAELAQS